MSFNLTFKGVLFPSQSVRVARYAKGRKNAKNRSLRMNIPVSTVEHGSFGYQVVTAGWEIVTSGPWDDLGIACRVHDRSVP